MMVGRDVNGFGLCERSVRMSWSIRVYDEDSVEYGLLEKAAGVLTEKSPRRYRYHVGVTYFDFGQNWKWTTILCDTGKRGVTGSYQALCPRDHEMIILSDGSDESMNEIADVILGDKYCPDKAGEGL